MRRATRNERGATIVEFAFVAPVLFALIFTMIDFSLIIIGNSAGSNAIREGARYGIINVLNADNSASTNGAAIVSKVKSDFNGLGRNVVVTVRCIDGTTTALTTKSCDSSVVPGTDLIEVKAQWTQIGTSLFVGTTQHSDTARLLIAGLPS